MNNKYTILSPRSRGLFSQRVGELYLALGSYLDFEESEGRHLCYTKIFLSDAFNQYQELKRSLLFTEFLSKTASTIIEQPPLDESKIALLVQTSTDANPFIFQSFRLTDHEVEGKTPYDQTLFLFQKYIESLKGTDMTLAKNLIRTWIYVGDIDVNYPEIVKARNVVFSQQGLTSDTHFIASTGIGGYSSPKASVAMDFLTCPDIAGKDLQYLKAPDHLNPTQDYGVAFERGTKVTLNGTQQCFISGTASIDKNGEVMYLGDITRQTARLLENIGALLADGKATMKDIKYFIIYLRDEADAETTENFMMQVYPAIPHLIVHAKVCRPEWLIEMECVAEK